MVKYLFVTLLLLATPLVLSNVDTNKSRIERCIYEHDNKIIQNRLKTEELYLKRDLKVIDSLTSLYVDRALNDTLVYLIDTDRKLLIDVIVTVALAEGSSVNKKGAMPFKSSLFIYHNNPFGIKGNGGNYSTIEYIKGNRVRISDGFKHYNSFDESINDFVYLIYRKYGKSFNSAEEIFYAMKRGGYFTHPSYEKRLVKIYKTIK